MKNNELKCPQCGAVLAPEDINVSKDVVLCRGCSAVSSFSELVHGKEEEAILDSLPPKLKVIKRADELVLQYGYPKLIGVFVLCFALFWNTIVTVLLTVMLTGGTYKLNGVEKTGGDFSDCLFMVPFIVVGMGTLALAWFWFFGSMILTLAPGRGEWFCGLGRLGKRWQFLLACDSRITLVQNGVGNDGHVIQKISVTQPQGKAFYFGSGIQDKEVLNYFVAVLKQLRG